MKIWKNAGEFPYQWHWSLTELSYTRISHIYHNPSSKKLKKKKRTKSKRKTETATDKATKKINKERYGGRKKD
jgi:hypothetical protein